MRKYSYRVRFAKLGKLRFLSHHDLMRAIERAVRRADLPVAMSEGFNPRPRIAFPVALMLGIESDDEVFEVDLAEWVPPDGLQARLAAQLPPELPLHGIEVLPPGAKEEVGAVRYEIEFRTLAPPAPADVARVLAACELPIERPNPEGTRRLDIRPYLIALQLEGARLVADIRITPQGTARPDEILKALGLPVASPGEAYVIRKRRTTIVPRERAKPRRP